MAMTAIAGPAWGAVGSAVAWKTGFVAIPAALSSLSRGAVIAVLVAGSLCYGGVGAELVVRWSVFQGVFGAVPAAFLSPSALTVVYIINYYWRVAKSRRLASGPPPGMVSRGTGESENKTDMGAKQQRKKQQRQRKEADDKCQETGEENTAEEEKESKKDKS